MTNNSPAQNCRKYQDKPGLCQTAYGNPENAGIVVNTQGHANAALAKSADKINMYDIYRAVEGDKPLLHLDTDTNPDCGIGINIQFAIGDFYHEIQIW